MQFKSFALFLTLLAGAGAVVASPAQTSQTAKPTSRTGSNTSINHLATNLQPQLLTPVFATVKRPKFYSRILLENLRV
ncbi:hypothetical protein PNOK_0788800 [Pyrrhoderma noxium]|uniref:Uncharacterized protein n=1 Tax=Pyrrhoderma noxium TaxID=2282107 RepID=A0A286U9L6_9AGAM|nr:hypothetical protein PNOK_0788800 [Pyrrhoderma noxium]